MSPLQWLCTEGQRSAHTFYDRPTLKWALCAYSELLAHDIVPYETIPEEFMAKVGGWVVGG